MSQGYNKDGSQYLDIDSIEDDVFREAAKRMRRLAGKSVSRKFTKLFVAEVTFRGKRHEVWFNRLQIDKRDNETLGGFIKKKCLDLPDKPKPT